MVKKSSLRRIPTQQRGQERVERILDAAAHEFARVGFEEATTNGIARRARTSVGSLYQFFPNKEAVLFALTDRYLGRLQALHNRILSDEATDLSTAEFYDRLVNALAEFYAAEPGFRSLFYGSPTSPHLRAAASKLHQECISRAEHGIGARMPKLAPEDLRLYAVINVEVIKSLLPHAETKDQARRTRVLGEIKKLLLTYMERIEKELSAPTASLPPLVSKNT